MKIWDMDGSAASAGLPLKGGRGSLAGQK